MFARYRTFIGLLILAMFAATANAAVVLTFSKVADSQTLIPNGTGTFNHFGQPSSNLIAPVISGTNVAFVGSRGDDQHGLYLYSNGALQRVADRSTPMPTSSTTGLVTAKG